MMGVLFYPTFLPKSTLQSLAIPAVQWLSWATDEGGNPPANQSRFDAQTYVQFGLTDTLTVYGETAFEHYAIGEPTPNTYNGLDYSGLGFRKKLWSTGEWVFAGEATVFIPGAHDSHAPAQEGNTGWAGEARLNAGRNFMLPSIPGFGWFPGIDSVPGLPQIMLMLQDFTTVSMSTNDPTFPAWRQSVVEPSVVYALNDKWSLQVGLFSTVWTVRTNTQHGVAVSVWRNF
jgi:hypothetical protein